MNKNPFQFLNFKGFKGVNSIAQGSSENLHIFKGFKEIFKGSKKIKGVSRVSRISRVAGHHVHVAVNCIEMWKGC